MSTFADRTNTTDKLIERMNWHYWQKPEIRSRKLVNQAYGYETHVEQQIQKLLRYRRSVTAKFIRFIPDSILCDDKQEYLLEYKVTRTPRYTYQASQWERGQIEADAFDNYLRLSGIGVNIAVLFYCPYHCFPLLCGKPAEDWLYGERQKSDRSSGSGTPYYNLNLNHIPRFEQFMLDAFAVPFAFSQDCIRSMLQDTVKDPGLQTSHARNSPYNTPQFATGFNWDKVYR